MKKYKNQMFVNMDLSNNHGESEFKICKFLQNNCKNIFETHLIVSNDADTILISLAQVYSYNIHVLINTNQKHYIVSIDKLTENLFEQFGYCYYKKLDFVFISLLNGNDYFPKLKYTNINKLLQIYEKSVNKSHTIINLDYSINISTFIKFILQLLQTIHPNLRYVSFDEFHYSNVKNYFNGLQWCLQLYISGNYPTYNYICKSETIHPMCLFLFLQNYKNHSSSSSLINYEKYEPISSEQYPLFVMPYSHLDFVNEKFHHIINKKLMFMYDEEFCKKCSKYKNKIKQNEQNKKNNTLIKKIKKNYIIHKKTHIIHNPIKYIDTIRNIIKNI
jgi:hypothetical protein